MVRRDESRDHYERRKFNRELAESYRARLGDDHPDWEIVIRFYAALHLVQAYLITKDPRFHASKHSDRWRAIHASPELRGIRKAYRMLQDVSEQVRYEPGFSTRDTHIETARANLTRVADVVLPKLRRQLPIDPTRD